MRSYFECITRDTGQLKLNCPFHTDDTASLSINTDKNVFNCFGCKKKGNGKQFYAMYHKIPESEVPELDDVPTDHPPVEDSEAPDYDKLQAVYNSYTLSETARKALADRRISDKIIADYGIKSTSKRIVIPVYNKDGKLVNLRKHLFDKSDPSQTKVLSEKGFGTARIYGFDTLSEHQTVVLSEGELDRLCSLSAGVPAVTATCGADTFSRNLALCFVGHTVVIAYDNDEAGIAGAAKVAALFKHIGVSHSVLEWPQGFENKGDITDYILKYGQEAYRDLVEAYKPDISDILNEEVVSTSLGGFVNPANMGKKVCFPAKIVGKMMTPQTYPCKGTLTCTGNGGKKCQFCNMQDTREYNFVVNPATNARLKLIRVTDSAQFSAILNMCGVQACQDVILDIDEYASMVELVAIPDISQALDGSYNDTEFVRRTIWACDLNPVTNIKYMITGYSVRDPFNQDATCLVEDVQEMAGDTDYVDIDLLRVISDIPGTITDKLNRMYTELEDNVTKVYGRRDIHELVDICFHSAIKFRFEDNVMTRGWVDITILGDSGQAKTTMVERMIKHYRHGEKISGESAKRTGIVYSMTQSSGGGWMLNWGVLPVNDGGLVVIDETSGLEVNDLEQLSEVRSSGIARVTGVVQSETTSRVRLITLSNPRSGAKIAQEVFPVEYIRRLWGKSEDVRRLDAAAILGSGDVNVNDVYDHVKTELDELIMTSDACHNRLNWSWSRTMDDIVITDLALKEAKAVARKMSEEYVADIPLVEPMDQLNKVLRLSVGLASMLVSSDAEFNKVIVKEEHVKEVYRLLSSIYEAKSMNYKEYSEKHRIVQNVEPKALDDTAARFSKLQVPINKGTVNTLLKLTRFSTMQLSEMLGLTLDDTKVIVQFLTENDMVEPVTFGNINKYQRTLRGAEFLKQLDKSNTLPKSLVTNNNMPF